MKVHFSQSEENGIKAVPVAAINIYSVGISTAGEAEIRIAQKNKNRKIIATTIDKNGASFANSVIRKQGFTDQVTVKLEDITSELPYADNFFDFEYARLVLHYLPKSGLVTALDNLYRILKPGSKIFIAVRSTNAENFSEPRSIYDKVTGFTTYSSKSDPSILKQRFFHTPKSISEHVKKAGFHIEYVNEYDEVIYSDFKREGRPSNEPLIELVAIKQS